MEEENGERLAGLGAGHGGNEGKSAESDCLREIQWGLLRHWEWQVTAVIYGT